MFTEHNTDGYTSSELNALNAEWEARAAKLGLEPHTDEYQQAEKAFADEVSRR